MTAPLQRENLSCLQARYRVTNQPLPLHWCSKGNLPLYTGAMMRDLAVEQHSTWNGLAFNYHTEPTWHGPQSSTRKDA